jgi:hypothetical protein
MELSYKVRSADGQEYGPATLDQLIAWIYEGRVLPAQEIQRNDMQHWAAAGKFTELQEAFGASAPPLAPAAVSASGRSSMDPSTVAKLRNCASWFFWVAGLSLINSFGAFFGGEWRFLFGLGVTQIFDGIGATISGSGQFVALLLGLVAAGALIALGVFGGKRHTWAFITGMVLLILDGGIQLIASDWIGAAFHAFVVFRLFQGMQASRALNAT